MCVDFSKYSFLSFHQSRISTCLNAIVNFYMFYTLDSRPCLVNTFTTDGQSCWKETKRKTPSCSVTPIYLTPKGNRLSAFSDSIWVANIGMRTVWARNAGDGSKWTRSEYYRIWLAIFPSQPSNISSSMILINVCLWSLNSWSVYIQHVVINNCILHWLVGVDFSWINSMQSISFVRWIVT